MPKLNEDEPITVKRYRLGPYTPDDVIVFCMLAMTHSAIHIDALAARQAGYQGITVPTPMLIAALSEIGQELAPDHSYQLIERGVVALCGEVFDLELTASTDESASIVCTGIISNSRGEFVLRMKGTKKPLS
jgi:hydroxyacyl-ACP dehydratase HTD2-like protein with hotdog domain